MDGDISGMLRQVMDNPQFGNMMQAMKAQVGDGDGAVDPAKMMEKLPEMMTVLGPVLRGMMQEETGGKTDEVSDRSAGGAGENAETPGKVNGEAAENQSGTDGAAEKPEEGMEQNLSNGIPGMFFRPGSREKRNKLLSALKPYLSPARCAIVDRAMSAMQLGEILGTMTPSGK